MFPPVGQGRRGGPVAERDQIVVLRGLGHGGAHGGAAGQQEHLARARVQQVVEDAGALAAVALQILRKELTCVKDALVILYLQSLAFNLFMFNYYSD